MRKFLGAFVLATLALFFVLPAANAVNDTPVTISCDGATAVIAVADGYSAIIDGKLYVGPDNVTVGGSFDGIVQYAPTGELDAVGDTPLKIDCTPESTPTETPTPTPTATSTTVPVDASASDAEAGAEVPPAPWPIAVFGLVVAAFGLVVAFGRRAAIK